MSLTDENLISLPEVCRMLPPGRNGARPALATILRWILAGTRLASGEVVKLEATRIGSRWATSKEAVARWSARLTPASGDTAPQAPTVRQRQRAAEKEERELSELGI
jgi:hypothetical protein